MVGIGHSIGGHALTKAAAGLENRFERLILIDPTIISPEDFQKPSSSISLGSPDMHPVAKRRDYFDSPEAMYERFKDREPYSLFTPESLRDYCNYGLLRNPGGDSYGLACPPVQEASVYMASRSNGEVYESIHQLQIPVLVIRAREPTAEMPMQVFSVSPTWPELAGEFARGRDIHYPDHTHFLPMEIPAEIAQLIATEIEGFPN